MDISVLEKSTLFRGISTGEIQQLLQTLPYHIRSYKKDETIFHMMDSASQIGIILKGRVQAQKPFPNGSQVNVSVRVPGDLVGPAAVFSSFHRFPCDIVALEPSVLLMLSKEALLSLMQKDVRILESFTTEIASSTYLLQQRLELLSCGGIAQKAAFWLLMQARQTGQSSIPIPESFTHWAMTLHVSRPSLYRELKRLEADGILSYTPPVITILNHRALQAVLNR